ncbi:MAG: hypothetical protein P1S46_06005 [bacterium]|nr:hypothetical protein [bacterium]MDT8396353.1 hypothetical protein [bacterium]
MARSPYKHAKRQKELAKKKKQEDKRQRKQDKKVDGEETLLDGSVESPERDASAETSDEVVEEI